MHSLILHPDCSAGPITSVSAEISPTPGGCTARFTLQGDISRIKIPEQADGIREDYLWKTTCFEIFWQPVSGNYYRELNLSPSSKWACYDFDDFRLNSRDAPADGVEIGCTHDHRELELEAEIRSELPLPAHVALNAIIEDTDGNIQFWAIAFEDGKPEFHSRVCRAIVLETVS
ncbi:hypothetical protein GCM10023115_17830 [Pontixanthobacter gangjinensis]|uniref:DOMON-like domain-containing protein n=1 Tax=Pontixanthobacter gangjinensis TaxID=1028742 RepID=A0A6I4SNT2_9SPHN|nr:hypothetical protein [Pontixanthobacter gangjinensis]MXO57028.1 hypothetical protein [Pontixanthobacter gangjinensis]